MIFPGFDNTRNWTWNDAVMKSGVVKNVAIWWKTRGKYDCNKGSLGTIDLGGAEEKNCCRLRDLSRN